MIPVISAAAAAILEYPWVGVPARLAAAARANAKETAMTTAETRSPTSGPTWKNARILAAEVPVSGAAAAALLPGALRVVDPPTATLFIADYPETTFGSVYREAAVLLHAADAKGPALHCPWMVVDDDTALILGREVLGFPKKMAEIALDVRGDSVTGSVRRKGAEVMRIEAQLGEDEREPAPLFGRRMVNAIGTLLTGMKLIDLPPASETFHSSRRALDAKVTLGSSERDPLGELAAAPSARARYLVMDFGGGAGAGAPGEGLEILGEVDGEWTAGHFFARAL